MAWTGSFMATSFKVELLKAIHNFLASGGHTFKIALYDNSVSFTAATTAYTSSGEITGTGYTAGGATLSANIDPASTGTTAFTSWTTNPSWTTATFTAYGAMIYNSSASNKCVCVLDFGGAKPVAAGTFTVVLPTNDSSNAILRIA